MAVYEMTEGEERRMNEAAEAKAAIEAAATAVLDEEEQPQPCYYCKKDVAEYEDEIWGGEIYHTDCLNVMTITCQRCDVRVSDDDQTYRVDGETWCESCKERHAYECETCGELMTRGSVYEYNDSYYCEFHYDRMREDDDEDEEMPDGFRDYSTKELPDFMSQDYGKIVKSSRVFSAEVEGYYPDRTSMRQMCTDLPRAMGISSDGSLNSRGVEFQTPKLQGSNGEKAIENLCKVLNDNGLTVDRSTGLHIHLDAKDLMPKNRTKGGVYALRTLFAFYLTYEDVLLSFLPPSRRGNRYCDNLGKSYHIREVLNLNSLEGLEKLWYRVKFRRSLKGMKESHYHESRYNGVNMHSLISDGHLEIRYHSGTTNARKVLEWANLHARIMDMSIPKSVRRTSWGQDVQFCVPGVNDDMLLRAMNIRNLSEKTERMFDLLKLTENSRAYFRERQAAFGSDKKDSDEAETEQDVISLDETGVCAA